MLHNKGCGHFQYRCNIVFKYFQSMVKFQAPSFGIWGGGGQSSRGEFFCSLSPQNQKLDSRPVLDCVGLQILIVNLVF